MSVGVRPLVSLLLIRDEFSAGPTQCIFGALLSTVG